MPHPPTLLRIGAHATPHASDPPDADTLYATIGKLMVAWGRLEGHVIGCLLTALNLPEVAGSPVRLPMQWDKRLDLWTRAFEDVPALKLHAVRALALMKRIIEEAEDRNFIAHAIWDEFVPGAAEPTLHGRNIKARKGTLDEIEVRDAHISVSLTRAALGTANQLNFELVEFSTLLNSLRPPPADVHRL